MSTVAMVNEAQARSMQDRAPAAEPTASCPKKHTLRAGERGVTLIEMLVVVTIIGLIVGIVGIQVFRYLDRAKVGTAKTQIKTFEDQLELYRTDTGSFPSTEQGLQALRYKPAGVDQWQGPYAAHDIPLDPWGHAYVYKFPGEHCVEGGTATAQNGDAQTQACEEPDILSYGADGQPGGDGINADIVSWK